MKNDFYKKIIPGKYKEYTGELVEVSYLAEDPDTGQTYAVYYYINKTPRINFTMTAEKFLEDVSGPNGVIKRFTLVE